ncbi:alpha/beta hydrolase [Lipingzhangella sp. LS1_29]|uniref:Alpha/beta hydrolase n=1 Tax=Lipingzhangella rawalii TaxID=2055835 RepID=A0ABU2H767_9ACTN|nr:alpha/beta hydrolase [Lipingzhangella rawalii]MDS1271151.1 alpha/beta hydrolase [Lipingzhangella rawalii]
MTTFTVHSVPANGLRFGYIEAGEAGEAPLALCLHGFPDTAHTFRYLLPELARAGYWAVAPFMRGYAPTEVPEDACYETAALATDVNALHAALTGSGPRSSTEDGLGPGVLIGHDWGAFAAYGAAALEPRRWRSVVALSSPPTRAIIPSFLDYDQLRRSFHQFLFQTPLAEAAVMRDDYAFLRRLWTDWTVDYDPSTDLTHVRAALRDQANVTAAISYFRGMFDVYPRSSRYASIRHRAQAVPTHPVLYLQGERDGSLGTDLAENARSVFAADSVVELVEGVGHFPHLERPAPVNRRILDWLS